MLLTSSVEVQQVHALLVITDADKSIGDTGRDGAEMALIPAGEFLMGSDAKE